MLLFILFTVITVCLMLFIFHHKIFIKTSTMAIVMALGIIIHGVLYHLANSHFFFIKMLSALTITFWAAFSFSIILSIVYRRFSSLHIVHPLNRFGIGTWIAGTSICAILIFEQFSYWRPAVLFLSYVNVALWIYYLWLSFQSFHEIRRNLELNVHGILLLTTVSTQSLVLLLNVIHSNVPLILDRVLISMGLTLYAASAFFIIRHMFTPGWTIEDDWANTNCILHGALSITGFACIVSSAIGKPYILLLWIAVTLVFLLVESLEVWRLIKRLRHYGFKQGLWTYNVTQWSRLFTFVMFYIFTSLIKPEMDWFVTVRSIILTAGIPIIFFLLMIELWLYETFLVHMIRKRLTHQMR
ncbi:hypothetical protein [Pseudobacillus wudalianchiensis]|uniref:Uncharacterized protein n=1 Tax=Pseudobacillus wudalianchiensis TaxID=1743143 RepID=A0A1B9ABQ6_9BACI|nr:hypothetical protein [Bacillus wudalianchiensis]OCA81277.1 hypothetical protein A8F95_16070 [Bacillus wudalianchiensis]